jgi:RNA polymerase subunit RPABC4/transcription elongation factor Spt4
MKQCPQCHHMNRDGAHFCTGCGAELEKRCNACGKAVPADARFCPQCGAVILSEPPIPWVERRFSPAVRIALHAVGRGVGITLLVMAFVTAFLTPPPRVFDEILLLILGAGLLVMAEVFKGRKPKPPDDGGSRRLADPDVPPPDGIGLIPPEELLEQEQLVAGRRNQPPSNPQGPYLN